MYYVCSPELGGNKEYTILYTITRTAFIVTTVTTAAVTATTTTIVTTRTTTIVTKRIKE